MSGKITLADSERVGLVWQKAKLSTNNGSCVEVASGDEKIVLRDSKDPDGGMLVYTPREWFAFLDGAKNGEFDNLI